MGRGTAVEAAAIHTAPRMAPAVLTAKELARDGGGNTILAAPAASSAVPEREVVVNLVEISVCVSDFGLSGFCLYFRLWAFQVIN